MHNEFDEQYLNVMDQILTYGVDKNDRTGVGSRAIWGTQIEIDLAQCFPIVTTRKTAFRIAFEETWFFLRGETDTKKLEAKNVNIWKGNTTREFLDKRGLKYLPEGNLGKGYGFQWRNFGGDYLSHQFEDTTFPGLWHPDYSKHDGKGFDQVIATLEGLQKEPDGRRHIISSWNPQQLHEMALPPCHLYQQYGVLDGKLNSEFLMRSWDFMYGAPFNIMGYALLNHAFAKFLKLQPGNLIAHGNDVHLYANQLEMAREQIKRRPKSMPQIHITKELNSIQDILDMEVTDFVLEGYEAHPDFKNKPGMAV